MITHSIKTSKMTEAILIPSFFTGFSNFPHIQNPWKCWLFIPTQALSICLHNLFCYNLFKELSTFSTEISTAKFLQFSPLLPRFCQILPILQTCLATNSIKFLDDIMCRFLSYSRHSHIVMQEKSFFCPAKKKKPGEHLVRRADFYHILIHFVTDRYPPEIQNHLRQRWYDRSGKPPL